MSAKKILIFSLAYHPHVGGAEIAVKEITDRIPEYEFDVITLKFSSTDKERERIGNVEVHRVGSSESYWNKILFVPRAAILALKLHKERGYDALWAIMTYMLFPIVLMRIMGSRTQYILTLQDGDPYEHVFARARIFPFLPLLLYGFKHANKVQTISNFLARWARHMGYMGDLAVIPNGINLKEFVPHGLSYDSDITLITTSRLVAKNGVEDIIRALPLLPTRVSLEILGNGPLENDLKSLAERLGVKTRVKFVGFVEPKEITGYLSRAHIFIRPSLSEGMGNSFIEAMAAGVPVIGTKVGGIPDFLHDRETGLFCEVRNPNSIKDKVLEYLEDQELRDRIIKKGIELSRKYDWESVTKEMKSRIFDKV